MKIKIIWPIAAVICLGVWCGWVVLKPTPEPSKTVAVIAKDMVATTRVLGRLESADVYTLMSKSEGQILAVPVAIGDWVQLGDPLVVLDTAVAEKQHEEIISQLRAQELSYQYSLERASSNRTLFQAHVISRVSYGESQQQVALEKAKLDVVLSQLQSSQLRLDQHRYSAPRRLQVAALSVAPGDVVMPGIAMMQLVDPFHLKLEVKVNEFDAPYIHKGQEAWISLVTSADATVACKVAYVQPILEKTGDNYGMRVGVTLTVTDTRWFKLGSQATVQFVTGKALQVAVIPLHATWMEGGDTFVWVKTQKGKEKRRIDVGLQGRSEIEVRSGVSVGDQVILP